MFPFEEKRHTSQRYRHVTNYIPLYDMSGFNNNQIIGSQSKGKRTRQGQPPTGSHHTHQQVETNQSHKNHGGIFIAQGFKKFIDKSVLRQIGSRISIRSHIRHTTKHGIRPGTEFSRLCCFFILFHLASTHTCSLDIISLPKYLPIDYRRRKINHRSHQQDQNSHDVLNPIF